MNPEDPLEKSGAERSDAPESGLDPALFARRPEQAVPVRYGTTWLHALLVLCLLVLGWIVLKPLAERWLWPKSVSTEPRDADVFGVLAYEGVSHKPDEVSPDQFREHLRALKAAGYTPISLGDVEAFYRDRKPLPRKALLLTMDQSRKTSYFLGHPILQKEGWNAVMFLWTKPIAEQDPAALLWPYLRGMKRSGVWEFGAQSDNGFSRIVSSPGGRRGHFMTAPLWNAEEKRYETLDDFHQRLREDHDRCLERIRVELGLLPTAYAYPFGDFGQFQHRAVVTRAANLSLAGQRYRLAFILGNLGINTAHTSPLRLNRLQVRPQWSGRDLVAELARSWPRPAPAGEGDMLTLRSRWVLDWGGMDLDRTGMTLYAQTNVTGSRVWLAGSNLLRDYRVDLRFRIEEGQFGLNFRASGDGESFLLFDMAAPDRKVGEEAEGPGSVWLHQKREGSERFVLASSDAVLRPHQEHRLEIMLRDRYFIARLDGVDLFRERHFLRGAPEPGLFGFSAWSPQKGRARVRLLSLDVKALTPTTAEWTPDPAREPRTVRWIARNAYRLTELSPRWLDISAPGPWGESGADLGFYRMLARVHHLGLFPQVTMSNEYGLRRVRAETLAERAARERVNGLLINLSSLSPSSLPTLVAWLRPVSRELAQRGLGLMVRLPVASETHVQLNSLKALVPGAKVTVEANTRTLEGGGGTGEIVRMEPVPAESPDPDEELPLFFAIPSTKGDPGESEDAKCVRLQQEGMAAYLEGQYEQALALWRDWQRLEPENPKAAMLAGDALSRLGDLAGAVREYDRSLDLDPGQIALAIRRAEFYTAMGRPEKTAESLNFYARLFPGNPEILLAQARWLSDHNRNAEASELVSRLLVAEPDNVNALILLLRLAPDAEAGRAAMDKLVAAGSDPRNHLALGQAVWKYALTSRPDAGPLHALVEQIAAKPSRPQVAEIYSRIRRQSAPALEDLADGRFTTNRWWVDGGRLVRSDNGKTYLAAGPTYSEGSICLLGSLRLRNAFMEATVGRTKGNFWLYVCRTPDHMVRFGFADDQQIHLQAWRGNRIVDERKVPYARGDAPVRLRVEIKGDGAMGYIDGKPAFDGSMALPRDMRYGWVGLAVFDPTRGRASAELARLAGGPSPVRLGILDAPTAGSPVDAQLAALRQDAGTLTAVCPSGFTLGPNGSWTAAPGADMELTSLFARYNRLWLAPVIECPSIQAVTPSLLEARAASLKADGFVLRLKETPSSAWMTEMREGLRQSPLRLYLAVEAATNRSVYIQPFGLDGDPQAGQEALPYQFVRRKDLDQTVLAGSMPLMIGY